MLFIPSSEAEISVLASSGFDTLSSAKVLINEDFVVQTSLDKYETLTFLKSQGIDVPSNGLVGETKPLKYPVIVKPRFGKGSKGLKIVKNYSEFIACSDGYVWQELLDLDREEYTCAIYVSKEGEHRNLIMKRKLIGGLTGKGEVVYDEQIRDYITSIANVLQLTGVINIQLRKTERGPLLFEINPRLSSTLVFRDIMGFCDLRWWVSDALGLKHAPYISTPPKTRFYRTASEYVLKP